MVSSHISNFAHLCTDPETIRHAQEALAAYHSSGEWPSAQKPWFREAARTFHLPETPDYSDEELEIW